MIEFIAGIIAGIALTKKVKKLQQWDVPAWMQLPKYLTIVKFGEGRYAIRRGFFIWGYEYKDLSGGSDYWWCDVAQLRKYCIGSLDKCKELYQQELALRHGVPIKDGQDA